MKVSVVAAAAAMLASGVSAARHHGHRHAHALFEKRGTNVTDDVSDDIDDIIDDEVCGCTTIYSTITGEMTRMWPATQTEEKRQQDTS
jgi:hypothetical protein